MLHTECVDSQQEPQLSICLALRQRLARSNRLTAGSLSEAELNASLRSAVEDKLKRRLREVHAEHAAELKKLERTQEQLSQRRNQLEEMISRAEKEEVGVLCS